METEGAGADVDAVAELSVFPLAYHCQMSLGDVGGCGIGSYGKWNGMEGGGGGEGREKGGEVKGGGRGREGERR